VFRYQYTFTRNENAVGAASSVLMLVAMGVIVLPYLLSEMAEGEKMANAQLSHAAPHIQRRRGSRENIRCWPDRFCIAA